MREIREIINAEISEMTPEQIIKYIQNGRKDYENLVHKRS